VPRRRLRVAHSLGKGRFPRYIIFSYCIALVEHCFRQSLKTVLFSERPAFVVVVVEKGEIGIEAEEIVSRRRRQKEYEAGSDCYHRSVNICRFEFIRRLRDFERRRIQLIEFLKIDIILCLYFINFT
jgi:hypothetical protein